MKRLLSAVAAALCLVACNDDSTSYTTIKPTTDGDNSTYYTLPSGYEEASVDSAILVLKSVASGVETTYNLGDDNVEIRVEDGLYNVSFVVYTTRTIGENEELKQTLRDIRNNVQISGGEVYLNLSPKAVSEGQGFLFAEVCLNAALAEGIKYDLYSSWFRIVNNSTDTLDASGLCIIESEFLTVRKFDYKPDVMGSAFAVDAIYRIPKGSNTLVAPGQTLLICDQAYNHQENNTESFDLSKADFEWYDETERNYDIDNPDVPNLERVYCFSNTVWTPNTQGNHAYALAYISVDDETFLNDYKYAYSYTFTKGDFSREMSSDCYMIPNDWIVDFVNFAPSTEYVWNVGDQSLDASYFSFGETGSDKNRLGKSARRKCADGKFVDTNDSANDFELTERGEPYYEF